MILMKIFNIPNIYALNVNVSMIIRNPMPTISDVIEKLGIVKLLLAQEIGHPANHLIKGLDEALTMRKSIERVTIEEYFAYLKEWHDEWYAEIIIKPKTAVEWPDYLVDKLNRRIFGEG